MGDSAHTSESLRVISKRFDKLRKFLGKKGKALALYPTWVVHLASLKNVTPRHATVYDSFASINLKGEVAVRTTFSRPI